MIKKNNLNKLLLAMATLLYSAPQRVFAGGLFGDIWGEPISDPGEITTLIGRALNLVFIAAAIVCFGVLIWGGFTLLTSGGDVERATKARKIITNGAIGLIITIFAEVIVYFAIQIMGGSII